MTLEEATAEIERLRSILNEREAALVSRDAEWSAMVRSIAITSLEHLDESDDVATLRECLVRTRLGASVERQCASARAVVVDLYAVTMPDGTPSHRFIASTPTGDMGELREVVRSMAAAFSLGARDGEQVRSWLAMTEGT